MIGGLYKRQKFLSTLENNNRNHNNQEDIHYLFEDKSL